MIVGADVALFGYGIKPAVLISGFPSIRHNRTSEKATKLDAHFSHYPSIYFALRGSKLYFRTEQDAQSFRQRGTHFITVNGRQYLDFKQDELGLALGFPPSAVDFFCSTPSAMWETFNRVSINYYGLQFICHKDDTENCLAWCNRMYTIPEELKAKLPYKVEAVVNRQNKVNTHIN